MKKITLSKIEHNGKNRIRIDFPYDTEIIQAIKLIEESRWSQTKKCWHVPYSKKSHTLLQKKFEVVLQKDNSLSSSSDTSIAIKNKSNEIAPQISAKSVSNGANSTIFRTIEKDGRSIKMVIGQQIIIEQENANWLRVFVPYDKKGWIAVIKNIAGRRWDSSLKLWRIPNVKESYRFIKHEIGLDNVSFQFQIPRDIPEYFSNIKNTPQKKTKKSFLEQLTQIQRDALIQMDEQLLLKRLSPSTRKTYKHHLVTTKK